MKKLFILLLLLFSFVQAKSENIYVEPGGSIYEAIQKARNLRRLGKDSVISIILKGDEYILNEPLILRPEDSGTEKYPLIIKSAEGKSAKISSKRIITDWERSNSSKLWISFAPPCKTGNSLLSIRQLWKNGKKQLRSNQFKKYELDRILDFNTKERTISIPTPKFLFEYDKDDQLEILIHQRWAIAILRINNYKIEGNITKLYFCEPESHLEFLHPWPQPIINGKKGSSSYCLQNSIYLLDEPGEWYQDENNCIFYNFANDIKNDEFCCAELESLFKIEGSSLGKVKNITIQGITFEYSAWKRPSEKGLVTLQGGFAITEAYKLHEAGLPWNENLENQAWIERPEAAISVEWAENIKIENCSFNHLSGTALDFGKGVKNSSILNNKFSDIGGTAIMVGSFGEGATEVHNPIIIPDNEFTENINIKNNIIIDATNEDWGATGIAAGYVRHTNIENNRIDNINYSGICVGWGWTSHFTGMCDNHIRNNSITNFAKMLYDAGGIYTLSNQPASSIENNYIDKIGNSPYTTNNRGFYIYLDEATDGYTIKNNWCPENKFGDNKPGPDIILENNGINAKINISNK